MVDDEPLTRDVEGAWQWAPGFFSGVVEARLRSPLGVECSFLLDVAADPAKLGRVSFDELLRAVRDIDPTLITGVEPAQSAIGRLGEGQEPWLEFRRLRRHAPSFVVGLGRITSRPLRKLERTRRLVSLRTARRVDLTTVRAAAASGSLALLAGESLTQEDRTDPAFDVPWVQHTFDSAANRCIAALLLAVLRRTRSLDQALASLVERESSSETRTALAPRWPIRRAFLRQLDRTLEKTLRLEPLSAVRRPEITSAGLTAVAANPDYGSAYQAGWKCLRPGLGVWLAARNRA